MVRNPRLLMMCGLLAAATGAVLGSHAMPTPHVNGLSMPAWMPGLAALGLLDERVWRKATPTTRAPVVAADQPLEGHRKPRGPRESRETLARPTR